MRKIILFVTLVSAFAAPALADSYPVNGAWGQSSESKPGPIDCSGRRVISFNGNQRTDSNGGNPAYRNKSVTPVGSSFRVVDEFSNAQVRDGTTSYTLRQIDADHLEMNLQQGGTLTLQRCQ